MLSKLKSGGFHATSLSTYYFSTLYTTLPYNFFLEKLLGLIEWTLKREGTHYFVCNERKIFSRFLTKDGINVGHARMYATPYRVSWIISTLGLVVSYIQIN